MKQLIINGKKSYDDFDLYISDRNISPPKKKSIKESVPFSNMVYDFSNINGEIYWEERKLEYSFDIAEISTDKMEEVKSKVSNWLMNVQDTDIYDPYIGDYHFHGSFDSASWDEDFGEGSLKVSFLVYPYKISNENTEIIESVGVDGEYGNVLNKNLYNYEDVVTKASEFVVDDEGWITIAYDNSEGVSVKYFNYWTNNLNLKENTNYNIFIETKEVNGNGKVCPASYLGEASGQFTMGSGYDFNNQIFSNQIKQNVLTTRKSFENIESGLRTYVEFKVGESGSITFRLSVIEDTTISEDNFVYREYGVIPIINNSSHRIAPTITSSGTFTITLNNKTYSVGSGTYTNVFYLESGENILTINGSGSITISYAEELF